MVIFEDSKICKIVFYEISFLCLQLCRACVPPSLPLPWALYIAAFGKSVKVSSEGLGCSIMMLFSMLMLVFLCIILSGWKMTKLMGAAMFVFYFLFVAASLSLNYGWVTCPV